MVVAAAFRRALVIPGRSGRPEGRPCKQCRIAVSYDCPKPKPPLVKSY